MTWGDIPEGDIYKNRDKILLDLHTKQVEMHTDMKHMVKWTSDHDTKDDKRFSEINKKLLYGGLAIILIASATGVLPKILDYFK